MKKPLITTNNENSSSAYGYGSILIDDATETAVQRNVSRSHSHINRAVIKQRQFSKSLSLINRAEFTTSYFRPYSPCLTARSSYIDRTAITKAHPDITIPNIIDENNDNKLSTFQAGFTVINLFLGLCLLSYPYALMCGSFMSIICFVFICVALCYTGKLIVRCFNALRDDVEHSYPMVGYFSFNNFGYLLISFGIIAELFGALCTNTIFLWTNVAYLLLPYLNLNEIILICSLLSLPTCWMLNFSQLSINSFLGCVCKIFTAIVVVFTFFVNLDDVSTNLQLGEIKLFPESTQSFCVAVGIFIMGFSGHPCLPSIYRDMKYPQSFEKMLDICFFIMCISYILISVFGYMTFGQNTNVIITGNLLTQNEYLSKTLIILVILGCYFQLSPLIAVMSELPEHDLFKLHLKSNSNFKIRLFRTFVFFFICVASYILMNKLQFLEAITGSICTMIVSVICPSLFYYKLFLSKNNKNKKIITHDGSCIIMEKENTTKYTKFGLRIILLLYVIIGIIFGIYMFINDFINAIHTTQ